MTEQNEETRHPARAAAAFNPTIRAIGISDINEAWVQGLSDFRAAPIYGLVFGGIYAVSGFVLTLSVTALGFGYLTYPLAAGFALLGPFAAIGLYEVSRRREMGLELTWRAILTAIFEQRDRQLAWMGFVTLLFFVIWMYQVQLLVALFLGTRSFATSHEFLVALTTTTEGIILFFSGTASGHCYHLPYSRLLLYRFRCYSTATLIL